MTDCMTQRGFATMTAMAMVLLVAMVAAALTARFAADARQTQRVEGEAQMRQLMIAGAMAARDGDKTVALPQVLAREGAGVTLARAGDEVTIGVTLSHERLGEQRVVIVDGQVKAVRSAKWQGW